MSLNNLESERLCFPDRLGPFSQNDQEMDSFASLQVVASWFLLSFSALALVASSVLVVLATKEALVHSMRLFLPQAFVHDICFELNYFKVHSRIFICGDMRI